MISSPRSARPLRVALLALALVLNAGCTAIAVTGAVAGAAVGAGAAVVGATVGAGMAVGKGVYDMVTTDNEDPPKKD